MAEQIFAQNATSHDAAFERATRELEAEYHDTAIRELREADAEEADLEIAGKVRRRCEICVELFATDLDAPARRCGACQALTCESCDRVCEDAMDLAPDKADCVDCRSSVAPTAQEEAIR